MPVGMHDWWVCEGAAVLHLVEWRATILAWVLDTSATMPVVSDACSRLLTS